MTSNIEINKKLQHIKEFIGSYPRDRLPSINKFPVGLIINTDKSGGKGEHWVAVHISRNKIGEYYDSYGLIPLNYEIMEFLDENCLNGWTYNRQMIQGMTSINCGKFCVIFIFLKFLGFSMPEINRIFSKNHDVNDLIVEKLYKELG